MSTRSVFNGELVDSLPVNNRATQYGDGVFRTMLVRNGDVLHQQSHIEKLFSDAKTIGLVCVAEDTIREALRSEAQLAGSGVIRLSLIAADSPRGYARASSPCHWLLQHSTLPQLNAPYARQGIALCGLQWQLSTQPKLAGVKHLNRLDQIMAKRLLPEKFQEGLVQDQQGHWISGIMSNLFWHQDGRWHTPAIEQSGVAGLTRALLLKHLEEAGMPAEQNTRCRSDHLHGANMIFVCNTLMGLWPVTKWVDTQQQQSVWSKQTIASFSPLCELQQSLQHPLFHV